MASSFGGQSGANANQGDTPDQEGENVSAFQKGFNNLLNYVNDGLFRMKNRNKSR